MSGDSHDTLPVYYPLVIRISDSSTTVDYREETATPGWTPGPGPDGSPKPYFPEGTRVMYNLGIECFGYGTVRGLAMQHVIDIWIVEREASKSIDERVYPWSCITVPHTCLKQV